MGISVSPLAQEASVGVPNVAGGASVKAVSVQAIINGAPVTVVLQALALGDPVTGRWISADELFDYDFKIAMIDELRAIRLGMQELLRLDPAGIANVPDLLADARASRDPLSDYHEDGRTE